MIRDGEGRRMTPSHATKAGIRYRYYAPVNEGERPHPRPIRIAAAGIKRATMANFMSLSDGAEIVCRKVPENRRKIACAAAPRSFSGSGDKNGSPGRSKMANTNF
jgi:hypothetical protein